MMMEGVRLMTARQKERFYSHSMVLLRQHVTVRVVGWHSHGDQLYSAHWQEMR